MDIGAVSLIGSLLLFLTTLITIVVNNRTRRTDTLARLEETISKAQQRADDLYHDKLNLEIQNDKLRNDLAIALVEKADLKTELAGKNGYIEGISTHPLINLEEKQKKELQSGRRSTDR